LEESRRRWRDSDEYHDGIKEVRRWRQSKGLQTDQPHTAEKTEVEPEPGSQLARDIVARIRGPGALFGGMSQYNLEKDVNAYLIQYTWRPDASGGIASSQAVEDSRRMHHSPARPTGEDLQDERFQGRFPHQHVSMSSLLGLPACGIDIPESPRNILSKKLCDGADPSRLRYVHIPSNNMLVSNTSQSVLIAPQICGALTPA